MKIETAYGQAVRAVRLMTYATSRPVPRDHECAHEKKKRRINGVCQAADELMEGLQRRGKC